jgi:hypothetical protein
MLDPTGKARDIASQGKTSTSPHWTPLHSTIRPGTPRRKPAQRRCAGRSGSCDRANRRSLTERLGAGLTPADLARLTEEGASLTPEAAIALALET